jgi:hypothetical protein
MPMRRTLRLLPTTVLAAGVLAAATAMARPPYRTMFFQAYPGAVGSRLDNLPSHSTHCGACHYNFNGGGARNPYGARLDYVFQLFGPSAATILSIGAEDSDGDGVSNQAEITDLANFSNTPTFPGLTTTNVGSTSNVPNLDEITPYLVPVPAGDAQSPVVTVTAPNGAEVWTGGSAQSVTWTATDNVGVTAVDVFYRDHESSPWTQIAANLSNSGAFTWFVHNTPGADARVRVVARDAAGNAGADTSDAVFAIAQQPGGLVATTLRDFHQPGTQPFGGGTIGEHSTCMTCHGNYDPAVEPGRHFEGTMMAQAARDPLFRAALAVAEQDAPSSGDLCIRCHSPGAWLQGRSQPTDGSQITAADRDGVNCDFCHRAVDPIYQPGVSPAVDADVLGAMLPAHVPTGYSNGQYVVDPDARRRGPFGDPVTPHAWVESAFHRSSDFCGTCHDVSNPVFLRTGPADYAAGPLDQPADSISSLALMPLERTYSEWRFSAFPGGVYAPDFAGTKPDGIVASCQDCHLRDVSGRGCNDGGAPLRANLPLHDMTGGNAWLPGVIAALYPSETSASALADGAERARATLARAAVLGLGVAAEGDSFRATVTVTNRTGHKLPTGYPEGRRMWLHVVAKDGGGNVVYESGAYDDATGVLMRDADVRVWEAHLGISPGLAGAIGTAHGPSFHFVLNDSVYLDNRIPPLGFTNAAFEAFGGQPVDPYLPAPRYADGQNWDTATYPLPVTARSVRAELLYQTTSKEYVEFLRDENTTNSAGDDLYALWTAHGRAAPVLMTADSTVTPVGVEPGPSSSRVALSAPNPFRGTLDLRLDLVQPARVRLEVFDVRGRRLALHDRGRLGGGAHRLTWSGRDASGADAGAGTFWVRVHAGEETLVRRLVRLR